MKSSNDDILYVTTYTYLESLHPQTDIFANFLLHKLIRYHKTNSLRNKVTKKSGCYTPNIIIISFTKFALPEPIKDIKKKTFSTSLIRYLFNTATGTDV